MSNDDNRKWTPINENETDEDKEDELTGFHSVE